MLAVVCRTVWAAGTLMCGQPMDLQTAYNYVKILSQYRSISGVSGPFVVSEKDDKWALASASFDTIKDDYKP